MSQFLHLFLIVITLSFPFSVHSVREDFEPVLHKLESATLKKGLLSSCGDYLRSHSILGEIYHAELKLPKGTHVTTLFGELKRNPVELCELETSTFLTPMQLKITTLNSSSFDGQEKENFLGDVRLSFGMHKKDRKFLDKKGKFGPAAKKIMTAEQIKAYEEEIALLMKLMTHERDNRTLGDQVILTANSTGHGTYEYVPFSRNDHWKNFPAKIQKSLINACNSGFSVFGDDHQDEKDCLDNKNGSFRRVSFKTDLLQRLISTYIIPERNTVKDMPGHLLGSIGKNKCDIIF